MARYRPPRRYNPRRYRRGSMPRWAQVAAALCVAAVIAAGAGHAVTARAGTHHHHHGSPARAPAVADAISYARAQLGKPYLWGGRGPDAYDCSGLTMMAYRAAGITIAPTSQTQWATEPHIPPSATPRPGWLVFFAGSDGTWSAPGHVALVIGRHTIIQAYATGSPIMISSFGRPGSPQGVGAGDVIGYTNPAAAGGA